jgi:hypothetical protein
MISSSLILLLVICLLVVSFANAQTLTLTRYTKSDTCNGTITSSLSYGVETCIFGAGGKTSALYMCNATHATMKVYTQTTDCTGRFYLTEPKLDECLKVISTSMRFTCSAGKVLCGIVVSVILVLCFLL